MPLFMLLTSICVGSFPRTLLPLLTRYGPSCHCRKDTACRKLCLMPFARERKQELAGMLYISQFANRLWIMICVGGCRGECAGEYMFLLLLFYIKNTNSFDVDAPWERLYTKCMYFLAPSRQNVAIAQYYNVHFIYSNIYIEKQKWKGLNTNYGLQLLILEYYINSTNLLLVGI